MNLNFYLKKRRNEKKTTQKQTNKQKKNSWRKSRA